MTETTVRKKITPGKNEDIAVQLETEFASILRDDMGYTASDASTKAAELVQGMRVRLGGAWCYIPVPSSTKRARDEAIRREFCGPSSLPELTRKYGLSPRRIYQIARQRSN